MSTVGYGDAYPLTANGRVAILCGAVVGGAIVISLLTSTFLDALAGSREEHKFLLALETMSWQKSIRSLAASLIASAWRDHVRRKASKRPRSATLGCSAALFRQAHQF
ncbi:hypothetical protein PINS_up022069 [Pythium insidiosum]|nr:hypothetical protein PINS_up022069 [Pythium insidiosum]